MVKIILIDKKARIELNKEELLDYGKNNFRSSDKDIYGIGGSSDK